MACPECDEDGQYFVGTPREEALRFSRRALWDLHRARQAFEAQGLDALAELVSISIRHMDAVALSYLERLH